MFFQVSFSLSLFQHLIFVQLFFTFICLTRLFFLVLFSLLLFYSTHHCSSRVTFSTPEFSYRSYFHFFLIQDCFLGFIFTFSVHIIHKGLIFTFSTQDCELWFANLCLGQKNHSWKMKYCWQFQHYYPDYDIGLWTFCASVFGGSFGVFAGGFFSDRLVKVSMMIIVMRSMVRRIASHIYFSSNNCNSPFRFLDCPPDSGFSRSARYW